MRTLGGTKASSCLTKGTPVDRNGYVGSTGLGPERNTTDRVRRTIGAAASKNETPVPVNRHRKWISLGTKNQVLIASIGVEIGSNEHADIHPERRGLSRTASAKLPVHARRWYP